METQVVKTERNYHHARAKDRRKGRALENDGTVFKYEAIQAYQTFQGAVLGSEDDLRKLKEEWLDGLDSIKLGRSRSAQYGMATFEWMVDVPQKLDELSNEWDGFAKPRNAQSDMISSLGKYLIITTLSPLLSVNLHGHPDVQFPKYELAERLKVAPKDLELLSSYTRTELVGGYHTHLTLPKQQLPAIAAGSVFVFKGKQDFDEGRLLQLEQDGMGLRKGEGYGRIAVNRQDSLSLTGREEEHLDDPNEQSAPNVSDIRIPQEIQELLQTVIQARCLAEIKRYAIKIANQMNGNIPSNHLLGRLRLFLSHAAPAESLAKLRESTREKLEKYKIDIREFNMPMLTSETNELTLHALFKAALTKPHTLTETLIRQHVEKLIEYHYAEAQQLLINILVDKYSTTLCQDFLDYLLTVLHRKNKS